MELQILSHNPPPAAIIALGGQKRAGKTEGCKLLQRVFPGALRYAFATPLKQSVQAMYGLSDDQLHSYAKDAIDFRYNCTPRDLLLRCGDEARAQHPKLFVNRFLEFYEAHKYETSVILVEDWRLPIEGEALWALGAHLILVYGETNDNNETNDNPSHPTEDSETLRKAFEGRASIVYNNKSSRKQYLMDLLEAIPLELTQ